MIDRIVKTDNLILLYSGESLKAGLPVGGTSVEVKGSEVQFFCLGNKRASVFYPPMKTVQDGTSTPVQITGFAQLVGEIEKIL